MRVYYEGCNVHLRAKQEDVIDLPTVIYVHKFDEETSRNMARGISLACQRKQPIVPVVIDSLGGLCYNLLTMIGQIMDCPIPVATIVEGKAMSAGAFLLGCGTEGYRYAAPESTIMLHQVRNEVWGKNDDMKANVKETDRLNRLLFSMLAKNCGKSAKYFSDMVKKKGNVDCYMTPAEARKHGLVNHIRIPEFRTRIKVEYEFG